ncbi:hypothetical protein ACFQNF_00390 [Iodobacter arcticus]|uniref:ATPase n=1 Tax=Iodobacter arcticus TaxID=590593 RepID=A0ABW2QRF3_9NEIS
MKHYPRTDLAKRYCDTLSGLSLISSTKNLFLAAPRRVGKTQFINNDLIPEAQSRGWLVIYVDLWSDQNKSPSALICEALHQKSKEMEGRLLSTARSAGIAGGQIGAGEFKLDFTIPAEDIPTSVSEAYQQLKERAKNHTVMLVVDEAQQALSSDDGKKSTFALKSIRDTSNQQIDQAGHDFVLVFTGSQRDKLSNLCSPKTSAFYGSSVEEFPLLDSNFIEFFIYAVNDAIGSNAAKKLKRESTLGAFQILGCKPDLLIDALGKYMLEPIEHSIQDVALNMVRSAAFEIETTVNALTPIQRAIFKTITLNSQNNFAPFSSNAISQYAAELPENTNLTVSTVQAAISALRDQSLLWQPSSGKYLPEDSSYLAYFRSR